MNSLKDQFLLLKSVVPTFLSDISHDENDTGNSDSAIDVTNFKLVLTELSYYVFPVLSAHYEGANAIPKIDKGRCMEELEGLLASLDTLYRFPRSDALHCHQYPNLETIRQGRLEDHKNPFVYITEAVVENIETITRSLRDLLGAYAEDTYGPTEEQSQKTCLSSDVILTHRLLGNLKQVLNAKELWGCRSSHQHTNLMFLATHNSSNEHDSCFELNMFFARNSDAYRLNNSLLSSPSIPAHASSGLETEMDLVHSSSRWAESKAYILSEIEVPQKGSIERVKAPPLLDRISSLCKEVSNLQSSRCLSVGFKDMKLHHTSPTAARLQWLHTAETMTLSEVLQSSRIWTPESRLILSILISYAVLYFTTGPNAWLPSRWDEDSIHFLLTKGSPILFQPLLASERTARSSKMKIPEGDLHERSGCIDFHRLGIILLELFLNRSIEEFRTAEDGAITTDVDFYTACRIMWQEDMNWDVYQNYQNAADACLKLDLPDPGSGHRSEEFTSYFLASIISPLEKELYHLCKIKATNLDQHVLELVRNPQANGIQNFYSTYFERTPNGNVQKVVLDDSGSDKSKFNAEVSSSDFSDRSDSVM